MMEEKYVKITPELIDKIKEETAQGREELMDIFGDDIKVMEHSYIYLTSESTDQKAREFGRLMRKNKEEAIREVKEFVRTKEREFEAEPDYIKECEDSVDEVYRRYLDNISGETLFRLERSLKHCYKFGETIPPHKKYKTRRSLSKYEKKKLRKEIRHWITSKPSQYEQEEREFLIGKLRPVAKEKFEDFRKKYPQYEINFDEVNYHNPEIEVTFREAFERYNL